MRRDLGEERIGRISRALSRSIEYGLAHRAAALDHAMRYARGLPREKADQFVGMYVNAWTQGYGEAGRRAVQAAPRPRPRGGADARRSGRVGGVR